MIGGTQGAQGFNGCEPLGNVCGDQVQAATGPIGCKMGGERNKLRQCYGAKRLHKAEPAADVESEAHQLWQWALGLGG